MHIGKLAIKMVLWKAGKTSKTSQHYAKIRDNEMTNMLLKGASDLRSQLCSYLAFTARKR